MGTGGFGKRGPLWPKIHEIPLCHNSRDGSTNGTMGSDGELTSTPAHAHRSRAFLRQLLSLIYDRSGALSSKVCALQIFELYMLNSFYCSL